MKLKLGITKLQYNNVIFHLSVILFALIIGVIASIMYGQTGVIFGVVGIFCILMILSLLDYLDIIELRKTSIRLTKCAVCSRVHISEFEEDEKGLIAKTVEIEEKNKEKIEKTFEHKHKEPRPLDGIIVANRLVCSDCVKKIQGIKWE